MITLPVIVLVGPYNLSKRSFSNSFLNFNPKSFIINTDDIHNTSEYSWQGIFKYADVVLDFGGWTEDLVTGTKTTSPHYMTWSGDDQETMKRLYDYLQERK